MTPLTEEEKDMFSYINHIVTANYFRVDDEPIDEDVDKLAAMRVEWNGRELAALVQIKDNGGEYRVRPIALLVTADVAMELKDPDGNATEEEV